MKKIFVNGSFDILHTGHLSLLNYAASLGNYLLVAIDSDRRIAEKKGEDRPFNDVINRAVLLKNLRAVDSVKIFDSDDELIDIIRNYRPHIMLVGSDWQGKKIIGSEYSGTVQYFQRVNDESTTKTIQRYLNRR
jgi:D-beta-D-heptose 7-phosphate kinase/D-beta-D-heptose 1-phosphate adenosyltransferase